MPSQDWKKKEFTSVLFVSIFVFTLFWRRNRWTETYWAIFYYINWVNRKIGKHKLRQTSRQILITTDQKSWNYNLLKNIVTFTVFIAAENYLEDSILSKLNKIWESKFGRLENSKISALHFSLQNKKIFFLNYEITHDVLFWSILWNKSIFRLKTHESF